jgi:hypothetical protein
MQMLPAMAGVQSRTLHGILRADLEGARLNVGARLPAGT